ncbi:MAG: peptidylprolyl isomerase [Phycisphaerae bacterium]
MKRLAIIALIMGAAANRPAPVRAQNPNGLQARLTARHRHVQPGQPLWVEFSIINTTDSPVELSVPDTTPIPSAGLSGLPLAHVFSGPAFSGLVINGGPMGRNWDVPAGYQPPQAAEVITLGPRATVGLSVKISRFYRILRTPGRFRLQWTPYGAALTSNELVIDVATPKQAVIQTDVGNMTIRFFYDDAPHHIVNFLNLARDGFYDNLTFHRIVPGYCVQGGCPLGDGTGIRPDGVKLEAELSDRPVKLGTVCMARLEEDLDSASCQFLICASRIPQWDRKYTAFGELVGQESFQTLEKLQKQPTDPDGRPLEKVYMREVRIVDAPRIQSPAAKQ